MCHPKSMVHLIFLVLFASQHTAIPPSHSSSSKPNWTKAHDRMPSGKIIPTPCGHLPSTAKSLNTSVRWNDPTWVNLAGASAYTSRSATRVPPKTTPSATLFSLERKAILSTTKQRDRPPPMVGAFWYSHNTCKKDTDEPPKKPEIPPAPNIDPLHKPATMMMTRRATKAQEACKEQLEALQQIKKQCLLKKKQQDEERKQAEIEAKQRQDAEAKEQTALVQPTAAITTVPPSNNQHGPNINRHLFNLNSRELDDAPDLNDRSPPSCKQRSTSGLAIPRCVSPTNQAPPAKPSERLAPNDPPPSMSASSPTHYH